MEPSIKTCRNSFAKRRQDKGGKWYYNSGKVTVKGKKEPQQKDGKTQPLNGSKTMKKIF